MYLRSIFFSYTSITLFNAVVLMNLQEVSDIKPCLMEAENSYPNQDEEVIHL